MSKFIIMKRQAILLLVAILAFLTAPVYAGPTLAPGETVNNVNAENSAVDNCDSPADYGCAVNVTVGENRIRATIEPSLVGNPSLSASVYTDFSILDSESGDENALVGSVVSATINYAGILAMTGEMQQAGYRITFGVMDMTLGVPIGGTVVGQSDLSGATVNDTIPLDFRQTADNSEQVSLAVPLVTGHNYRVIMELQLHVNKGTTSAAVESDFSAAFAGQQHSSGVTWANLSISAGDDQVTTVLAEVQDSLDNLEGRVLDSLDRVETALLDSLVNVEGRFLDSLIAIEDRFLDSLFKLQQRLENHTHTYLTGIEWFDNRIIAQTGITIFFEDSTHLNIDTTWPFGNGEVTDDYPPDTVHVSGDSTNLPDTTNMTEDEKQLIPTVSKLNDSYPNPFNPQTTISFDLAAPNHVSIKIYNSLGQEVRSLKDEWMDAGTHEVTFDATGLATGVYFYKLSTYSFTETKKLMLMK